MKQQNSFVQIAEVETTSNLRDSVGPTNGHVTLTKNQFAQIMKSTSVNTNSSVEAPESGHIETPKRGRRNSRNNNVKNVVANSTN
jgi:hypothetical protein